MNTTTIEPTQPPATAPAWSKESRDFYTRQLEDLILMKHGLNVRVIIDDGHIIPVTYSPDDVVGWVCETLNVSRMRLFGRCRKRDLVDARRIVAVEIMRLVKPTLKAAGRILGRDHSTVIHHCQTHDDLMITDRVYRSKYEKAKLP